MSWGRPGNKINNSYKVTVLRYGVFKGLEYSQLVLLTDVGKKVDTPIYGALIQGNGKNILIDLGMSCVLDEANKKVLPCAMDENDGPVAGIKKLGLVPEDIDYVIFTHLHWDHVGHNLNVFRNAKFVVQEKEWFSMLEEEGKGNWAYYKSLKNCKDVDFFRWQFVDGWIEFLDGIKLIPTYGHTKGQQSVLVRLEDGTRLLIAGDAANTTNNLKLNIPSGVSISNEEYLNSLNKVRMFADCFIAAHEVDAKLEPFQTSNFPKVPRIGD